MVVELAKLAHFIDFQISPQKIDTRYVPRTAADYTTVYSV